MSVTNDSVKVSNKEVPARRRLLKSLTAGGAAAVVVPSEWAKPALNSIALPAHAVSTGTGGGPGGGTPSPSPAPAPTNQNFGCSEFTAYLMGSHPSSGVSFSMSVVGALDIQCGEGIGAIKVFNSSGTMVTQCPSYNF